MVGHILGPIQIQMITRRLLGLAAKTGVQPHTPVFLRPQFIEENVGDSSGDLSQSLSTARGIGEHDPKVDCRLTARIGANTMPYTNDFRAKLLLGSYDFVFEFSGIDVAGQHAYHVLIVPPDCVKIFRQPTA